MNVSLTTRSADETRTIGAVIGHAIRESMALLLMGDYGAGKTTFAQGLAKGLDIPEPVRSPSYNILKRYDGGRRTLVHIDLYRTSSDADVEELGIAELMPQGGVLAVEWPRKDSARDLDVPSIEVRFTIPPGQAISDDEEERRELEFVCDEHCPISLIEVLVALAAG